MHVRPGRCSYGADVARLMENYVDAYSDPDNVSWSDSLFYTGSRRAGDALVPCLRLTARCSTNQGFQGKLARVIDASVDACGGMLETQAATVPPPEAMSKLQERMVQDVSKLTKERGRGRGKGKKADGGGKMWSRHWQNDVTLGRNAGCFQRRCGGSHGFWRSWCGAAVRVCQTFSPLS